VFGVAWIVLLVKTAFGSRLPFLFLISSLQVIYYIIAIVNVVIYNWASLGLSRGLNTSQIEQYKHCNSIIAAIGTGLYYETHWLFAWRYWQVAEVLSRVRGKSCCSNCCILSINVVVCILIAVNFFLTAYNDVFNDGKYGKLTFIYLPTAFPTTLSFILSIAVFRVYRLLRHERMVFLNSWFMALHAFLLFGVAFSTFITYY
jgi:hypothetical protein